MKHFLVVLAALALIAMPASAADGSGQTPTLEAISGGSEPAQNAPELLLPEPGSFTSGGALCDSCPAEAGCEIFDGTPVAGDTTNNTASGGGEAGDCADTSAVVDAYYGYVAACTGIVSVSATTAGGNPVIVIHGFIPPAGCNSLVACDDTGAGLSFNVTPGEIYFIRVGDTTMPGTFTLNLDCAPSFCGNDVIEPGEDCDGTEEGPCAGECVDCTCPMICPASTVDGGCDGTMDQSFDSDPLTAIGIVACGVAGVTTENGWARCFNRTVENFVGHATVESASFVVGTLNDGGADVVDVPVQVNIYAIDSCGNMGSGPGGATLLGTEIVLLSTAVHLNTLVTVPFTCPPTIEAGMDLVVEVEDLNLPAGNTVEFRVGKNDIGQCDVTYLRAAGCGISSWLPTGAIGFPDHHMILSAEVVCSGPPPVCGNDIIEGCEICDGTVGCDPGLECQDCSQCVNVAPPNDDCDSPGVWGGGANVFSNIAATTDGFPGPGCQFEGQIDHDIWNTYITDCEGTLRVTTCSDLGGESDFDSEIHLYGGGSSDCAEVLAACPDTTAFLRGCNDDDLVNPCGANPPFEATVEIAVVDGECILIRTGGSFSGETGVGIVRITCIPHFCGDKVCDEGEQCECDDCPVDAIETSCTDGVDNDCDGTTDCADDECADDEACQAPIPTVSEWGMIALTLLLVVVGGGMIVRRRRLA